MNAYAQVSRVMPNAKDGNRNDLLSDLLNNDQKTTLSKLVLNWVSLQSLDESSILQIRDEFVSLTDLRVEMGSSFNSFPAKEQESIALTTCANIFTILQEFQSLTTLDICVPEPKGLKHFTKLVLHFLQHSQQIDTLTLVIDHTHGVSEYWVHPGTGNKKITYAALEGVADQVAKKVKVVTSFSLILNWSDVPEEGKWFWIERVVGGLRGLVNFSLELVDDSCERSLAEVPSILADLAKQNCTTIRNFGYKDKVIQAKGEGDSWNPEEFCIDFDKFRGCENLETLEMKLHNPSTLRNVLQDLDLPSLKILKLSNIYIDLVDVVTLVRKMTLPNSTLHLENVQNLKLLKDANPQISNAMIQNNSERTKIHVKRTVDMILVSQKISSFILGRLPNFPKEGIEIKEITIRDKKIVSEKLKILKLNRGTESIHINNFQVRGQWINCFQPLRERVNFFQSLRERVNFSQSLRKGMNFLHNSPTSQAFLSMVFLTGIIIVHEKCTRMQ